MANLTAVNNLLIQFRDDRNWKQSHTLKNLITSLNLESAELLDLTQWKTDDELACLKPGENFQQQLQDERAALSGSAVLRL